VENHATCELHPEADLIEEYLLGRLPEPETAALEEHLLICERCCLELDRSDEFIRLMKHAAASYTDAEHRPLPPFGQVWLAFGWKSSLAAILGAGLVTAALAVAIPHRPAAATPPPVQLVSLRGGDAVAAHARAGTALDLTLDTTDLGDDAPMRIEIVDAIGREVWTGTPARFEPNRLAARIPQPFRAGVYYVRLYSRTGELLREFALVTE